MLEIWMFAVMQIDMPVADFFWPDIFYVLMYCMYITASGKRLSRIKISYRTHTHPHTQINAAMCWMLIVECIRKNIDFLFRWMGKHNGYLFLPYIELVQVQTISPIFSFSFLFIRSIHSFLFRSLQQARCWIEY